jgi:hypothetical protein
MGLNHFLRRSRIKRYRRQLDSTIDETERRTIPELLAEKTAELKSAPQQNKPRRAGQRRALTAVAGDRIKLRRRKRKCTDMTRRVVPARRKPPFCTSLGCQPSGTGT